MSKTFSLSAKAVRDAVKPVSVYNIQGTIGGPRTAGAVLTDYDIRRHIRIDNFVDYGECKPGTVSYGLTSAGYDLRVSDRFKIFTDVHGAVVDPKHFDPQSFVDVKAKKSSKGVYEPVLIPANSFALAATVERLFIPSNIVCWCVGKSTYARCFSEDTTIALVDGSSPTFYQAAKRLKNGERLFGYGVDRATGEYVVTELTNVRKIGEEPLYRMTLDDGASFDCTPDHEFLRHNGAYTRADEFQIGDGFVPLYRQTYKGYEQVWIPGLGWLPTHWLSDNWNTRHGVYAATPGTHRHHEDRNKRNNNPTNIERIIAGDHTRLHNAEYYGEGFDSDQHAEAIKIALANKFADPTWAERFRQLQAQKALDFHYRPEHAEARTARTANIRKSWSLERKAKHAARIKQLWAAGKMRPSNHKLEHVEKLKGRRPVWCLESKDTGNFALGCGIIAKNCGINMNFTPFEPGWWGVVTVEIINATPLPVRIYPYEGIGQAQFFLLTSTPEKAYGDKPNAKYQGQKGLTTPKVK